MKVSVIIPMHNSASTIIRCVDSVLSQVFDDFEVIIIDDGSTDSSVLTVEEGYGLLCGNTKTFHYADSTVTMTLLGYKDNQGVSFARNMGIEHAQGEWLAFVDSDDYVREDFLSILYNAAIKNDADVAWCGYTHVNIEQGKENTQPVNVKQDLISGMDFLRLFYTYSEGLGSMCTKIYRANIIHDNNIRLEIGRKHGEDWNFNFSVAQHIESVAIAHESPYVYVFRKDSSTAIANCDNTENKIKSLKRIWDYRISNRLNIDYPSFEHKITAELASAFYLTIKQHPDAKHVMELYLADDWIVSALQLQTSPKLPLKLKAFLWLLRHGKLDLAIRIISTFKK
ncbi:MAG: glycosyltransferase family 2 protein [Muribaculaceae bacterium]